MQVTQMSVQSLGREDPLEEEMATHSSILAWEIPWTEEPRGQQSMRSQRDRHNRRAEQKKEWKGNEDSKKRPPLRNSAFCNKAENDTGARGFSFPFLKYVCTSMGITQYI